MEESNSTMKSKRLQPSRSLETITECVGFAFVIFLIAGPMSILLARVMSRTLPLSELLEAVTSYSPARIRSENIRIVTEGADYLFFILLLILVGITILTFLFVLSSFGNKELPTKQILSRLISTKFLYPISLILVFFHFASLHEWRTETFGHRFLDGFGMGPTILAIGVSIVLSKYKSGLFTKLQFPLKLGLQKLSFLICALILVPQIPAFGRAIGTNREFGVIFNEYAAPAAGLQPFQNFASTYTSLAGYIIRPAIVLAGANNVIRVTTLYHMVLSTLLIFVLLWLSKRIMRCNLAFAALFAAVLISVRSHTDLAQGFLPSTSNAPRFLLPLLVLTIASYFFEKQKPSASLLFLLGLSLALAMINNTEIGIPLTLSLLITLGLKVVADGNFVWNFLAVTLVTVAIFAGLLYLLSSGHLIQGGQDWLLWVVSRGSGGYINAVPVWGLHQFAFAIHSATLLFGVLIVILKRGEELESDLKAPSLMGAATGLFGITTFPYFLGQNGPSFIAGLLWVPLVLSTMALVGLLRAIWLSTEFQQPKLSRHDSRYFGPLPWLISSLFLCSLIFIPDPQNVVGIHFKKDAVVWSTETFVSEPVVQSIMKVVAQNSDTSKIAYYGEYGNLISILTGIESVYGTHDPMIAYSSRKSVTATCRPILLSNPHFVYASKRFIPVEFLDSHALNGPCPGLLRDTTFESEFLIRYVYALSGE